MKKIYYVFVAGNKKEMKIGSTSDMERKMKELSNPKKTKLLYFETFLNPLLAMAFSKKIKKLPDEKKLDLIKKKNPNFEDLFEYWNE